MSLPGQAVGGWWSYVAPRNPRFAICTAETTHQPVFREAVTIRPPPEAPRLRQHARRPTRRVIAHKGRAGTSAHDAVWYDTHATSATHAHARAIA
jgi:hypothetical protein